MIEWLSEIGIAVLLILLIASMYAFHLSTINMLLVGTEVEVVKFVTESGLVRVLLKAEDMFSMMKIYLSKYNETLGLRVLPAFNITITDNEVGNVRLYVEAWSGHILPSLNYSIMKIELGDNDIESIKNEGGTITFYIDTSLSYEKAIYVVTISCYKLVTFRVFVPEDWVKDNYNTSSNELYNASNILKVYAIIPFYNEPIPVNFTKYNDHVKLCLLYTSPSPRDS